MAEFTFSLFVFDFVLQRTDSLAGDWQEANERAEQERTIGSQKQAIRRETTEKRSNPAREENASPSTIN